MCLERATRKDYIDVSFLRSTENPDEGISLSFWDNSRRFALL